MEFNNPANRLHEILVELQSSNPHQATNEVLAKCFNVENTPKRLMHAIVQFHELVEEVSKYAAKTNLPAGPLARYIPQIESAVSYTNLDSAWGNYASRITTECLVTLEMIAQIDNVIQDQKIPLQELKQLEESAQSLFEEIEQDMELDKEFKKFVLNQIEKIRRAISEYRISGASGFSSYLDSAIVEAVKNKNLTTKAENTSPKTLAKFRKLFNKVAMYAGYTKDGLKALNEFKSAYKEGNTFLSGFGENSSTGSDVPELTNSSDVTLV